MKIPQTIGPYQVLGILGTGGMSRVYRARKEGEDEVYALKVLSGDKLQASPIFLSRFQREIQTLMSLKHSHIVMIRDAGQADGHYYLVMELLPGESVKSRVSKEPLSESQLVRLIQETVSAIDYCHERGVLHRDLKPTNVFLLTDGTSKVLDFGLAKSQADKSITTVGRRIGTPRYMAPEIIRGATADARSEVYQLGLVYYEAASGKAAFPDADVAAILRKVLTGRLLPVGEVAPGIPPGMATLIQNCLIRDPSKRYPAVGDIVKDLEVILSGGTIPSRA